MKRRDIRQWVVSKKKSFSEIFVNGRPGDQDMEIDTPVGEGDGPALSKTDFLARGNPFRIDSRYSFIGLLGLGAYGIVCAANDSVLNRRVAVKKVTGVFNDLTDAKRIIRETRLLCSMKHDNILQITDIDEPEDYHKYNDVYIVTELMDSDLNKVLRSSHQLIDSQRKFFAYQLLKAFKYIHSANILHRDLKPANVLVSAACDIKICDFGLARYVDPEEGPAQNMTEYVVTRWYRAPELLLAAEDYTSAIDMWSIGCLLAELYSRRPIFPGKDVKNQIEIICAIVGKPTQEEIEQISNRRARDFLERLPDTPRRQWSKLLRDASPQATDLIAGLLQFDPRKRLSAEQALQHPYVQDYRHPSSEVGASIIDLASLEPPCEKKLGEDGIRRLMWEEMLKYHPEARAREPPAAKEAEMRVREIEQKSR